MPKDEKPVVLFEIKRSFARKLNMNAHGGKQYETADILCEVSAKVPAANIEKASAQLDALCQAEVQKTIDAIDAEEKEIEETEEEKPAKKKKTLDVGIKVEQQELEAIQEYVNDLTMAKTAADLKAAVTKIKNNQDDMTPDEKKYLSAYYLKRKAAIEE